MSRVEIEVHAGRNYVDPLVALDRDYPWRTPLAGLGVGQQLGWYSRRRQLALDVIA